MTIDYDRATTLFAIAANEIRLRMMLEIANAERTVNELAEAVGMSQSPVSQHLAKLRKAGFVEWRPDGREYLLPSASRGRAQPASFLT